MAEKSEGKLRKGKKYNPRIRKVKGQFWERKYGMEWNGMKWNGMEWNGMKWNGME